MQIVNLNQDADFKTVNSKLTEQSKNVSKQYRELHRKFNHFEKGDLRKYQEIREMNLEEIRVLKEKILTCDQIITSQMLGFLVDPCKEILGEVEVTVEPEEPQDLSDVHNSSDVSLQGNEGLGKSL